MFKKRNIIIIVAVVTLMLLISIPSYGKRVTSADIMNIALSEYYHPVSYNQMVCTVYIQHAYRKVKAEYGVGIGKIDTIGRYTYSNWYMSHRVPEVTIYNVGTKNATFDTSAVRQGDVFMTKPHAQMYYDGGPNYKGRRVDSTSLAKKGNFWGKNSGPDRRDDVWNNNSGGSYLLTIFRPVKEAGFSNFTGKVGYLPTSVYDPNPSTDSSGEGATDNLDFGAFTNGVPEKVDEFFNSWGREIIRILQGIGIMVILGGIIILGIKIVIASGSAQQKAEAAQGIAILVFGGVIILSAEQITRMLIKFF